MKGEILGEPEVKLISITPKAEEIIERAYRNCWQSKPSKNTEARQKFIESRIKKGHLSCLEFATATFEIVGSRVFTHQLVRHRLASYAQESQRYVEVLNPSYIALPPKIQAQAAALEIFVEAVNSAWRAYKALLELGIPKEDARYVLPSAYKSKILVCMNFRAWRHFLKLRCEKSAQWEIRQIAMKILEILHQEAPAVFGDLYRKFVLKEEIELWTERD